MRLHIGIYQQCDTLVERLVGIFVVKAPLFLSEEEKVRLFSISRSDWVNRLFSPVSSAIRAVKP